MESHLRRLLLAAGVGSRHGYRELERRSGHRLSRESWRRMVQPRSPDRPPVMHSTEDLRVAADTLRELGERITFEQVERAFLADRGYEVVPNDFDDVLSLLPFLNREQLVTLLLHVAALISNFERVSTTSREEA